MVESAQWDVYWPWRGRGWGTRVKGGWGHESFSIISTVYHFKGVFIRGGGDHAPVSPMGYELAMMRKGEGWDCFLT